MSNGLNGLEKTVSSDGDDITSSDDSEMNDTSPISKYKRFKFLYVKLFMINLSLVNAI